MPLFQASIDAASSWLTANQRVDGQYAGWGWIPEIHLSALNTSEVVCGLRDVGKPVPRAQAVSAFLCDSVPNDVAGANPLYLSWQLRAFCSQPDLDATGCRAHIYQLIVGTQLSPGRWSFGTDAVIASPFVTARVLEALLDLQRSHPGVEVDAGLIAASVEYLADSLRNSDGTVAGLACGVRALSREEAKPHLSPRDRRSVRRSTHRLLTAIEARDVQVVEENFTLGAERHVWRQPVLPVALDALASLDSEMIFDPRFRRALRTLRRTQVDDAARAENGAFRLSEGGMVTTYATTLSLSALATIDRQLHSDVNCERVFERWCELDGLHPSDPQVIGVVAGRRLIVNSHSALVAAVVTSLLAGCALVVLFLNGSLPLAARRILFVAILGSTYPVAVALLSANRPRASGRRIAAGAGAAYTAVLLPIAIFLIS